MIPNSIYTWDNTKWTSPDNGSCSFPHWKPKHRVGDLVKHGDEFFKVTKITLSFDYDPQEKTNTWDIWYKLEKEVRSEEL
jgi:hypothetical protein